MTATAEPPADPFGGSLPGVAVRDLATPTVLGGAEPEQARSLPIAQILRIQDLTAEKNRLQAELDEVKRQRADLERELVEAFTEAQTNSTTVRGRTVYLQRTVVASKRPGVTTEQLVAALRAIGKEELITKDTVSAQTLSAFVREIDAADEELPPELAAVVAPFEKYEIRVNNGRASA